MKNEKAKEIALNYCEKMEPSLNFTGPKLFDYSDSSYLIGVKGFPGDGFHCVSVNKTTGYTFFCGNGSASWTKIGALYAI
ncbi:MAG: hypothetical protein IJD91_02875 [Clostridia bacterium]|nr:hypothetical protein [Clostridia bacterium]